VIKNYSVIPTYKLKGLRDDQKKNDDVCVLDGLNKVIKTSAKTTEQQVEYCQGPPECKKKVLTTAPRRPV
jgi:hypothetical protein